MNTTACTACEDFDTCPLGDQCPVREEAESLGAIR